MHIQSEKQASFFSLLQQTKGLSTKAKMVNLLLCFAEAGRYEAVSQEAMAKELELSMDSVNRGLRELKDHSLVIWRNRDLTLPGIYLEVSQPGKTLRPALFSGYDACGHTEQFASCTNT